MVSLRLPDPPRATLITNRPQLGLMRVRLTAKLAEVVNGIDLTHCAEGDIIEVSEREARLLIAERWAEMVPDLEEVTCVPAWQPERAEAADTGFRVTADEDDQTPTPRTVIG